MRSPEEHAAHLRRLQRRAEHWQRGGPLPESADPAIVAWREPRFGAANPQVITNPLWAWALRTRRAACEVNKLLHVPDDRSHTPAWCFARMGQTSTTLPDGRIVHIAGEHEDFYDPDFFIYNDVTVVSPDGSVEIFGYPLDVFQPTDFHSATLVGDRIVLIGCLGWSPQREPSVTPVYTLALDSWVIERVETGGAAPGWIHAHEARLAADGGSIEVTGGKVHVGTDRTMQENIDAWSLDLATMHWTRLTRLDWQRWTMRPSVRRHSHLWELRHRAWAVDNAFGDLVADGERLRAQLGHEPDLSLLNRLYALDAEAVELEQAEGTCRVYRVAIDGVVARFSEEDRHVAAIVEGRLSDARLHALQRRVLDTLSRLENTPWVIDAD